MRRARDDKVEVAHHLLAVSEVAHRAAAQVRAGTLSPVMGSERIIHALFAGPVSGPSEADKEPQIEASSQPATPSRRAS